MKKSAAVAIAVLLTATSAFAQTASQSSDTSTQNEFRQSQMSAQGRITTIDLSEGTVTLDNGMQFSLAPSLQYTSFPALGQEVRVTYEERGGTNVARIIDVGGGAQRCGRPVSRRAPWVA